MVPSTIAGQSIRRAFRFGQPNVWVCRQKRSLTMTGDEQLSSVASISPANTLATPPVFHASYPIPFDLYATNIAFDQDGVGG